MGVQVKRTLIVTLVGLAVTIAIAAMSALSEGRLAPIDPMRPMNAGIMGYWVGNLGWIPLIAAIVVMIVGFRRSGVGISIAIFLGAVVALVAVICTLVAVVASAYPVGELPLATPGPERDAFMRSATESCFRKQRPPPSNNALSDADVQKFCRCVAEAIAGQTRREDIDYQEKNKTFSPAMASRITQAARTCAQDLRK
jgi:hypothetical protein